MPRAHVFPYARAGMDGAITDTWTSSDYRYGDLLGSLVDEVSEITTDYNGDGTADATNVAVARILRCVRNTSAAEITVGQLVIMEAGETDLNHVIAAPDSASVVAKTEVRGVAIGSIPVGSEGWVVCKGKVGAIVNDDDSGTGTISAVGALQVGLGTTDGTVQTWAAVEGTPNVIYAQIGFAFATAAADATPTVYIDVL